MVHLWSTASKVTAQSAPSARRIEQTHSVVAGPSATAVNNCVGFSATIEALRGYLGTDEDDLEWFDLDSLDAVKSERAHWLCDAVDGWTNGSVEVEPHAEWTCPSSVGARIHLASHACNAVRPKPSNAPSTPPGSTSIKLVRELADRPLTFKSASFFRSLTNGETIIVVAIRAFGGFGDRVVAANWALEDVPATFIDPSALASSTGSVAGTRHQLQAHRGFLKGAENGLRKITPVLDRLVRSANAEAGGPHTRPLVLFTGHSAGGAVASLLFAHFLTCARNYTFLEPTTQGIPSLPLSCITFGAPPILSSNITDALKYRLSESSKIHSQSTEFLALVNEGDPVVRLDNQYTEYLLKLCRDAFRTFSPSHDSVPLPLPQSEPPGLSLNVVGDLLMFRKPKTGGRQKQRRVYRIDEEALRHVVFANLHIHYMYEYMKTVNLAIPLGT